MRKITLIMRNTLRKIMHANYILILGFTLFNMSAIAQCDDQGFVDACAFHLGDEYSYLRTFEVEEKEGSTDYPYTGAFLFRKGINYVFTSCGVGISENAERIVVNLYNRTRKLVASSYNKESGKHYDKMIFKCNATGIFFVQTLAVLDENSCGITMLGFDAQ